ncbi:MAG: cyclic nucleotide-binding domain-containing protein [Dehalococcoidia bacterium]
MITKRAFRECEVFQALGDADLEQLLSLAVEREYEAGDAIFHQGDVAKDLLVLQGGKAALQMQLSVELPRMSKSVTVDIVTNNDVLGWSAIVEPHFYTFTAVCLQRVNVLAIDGIRFRALLQDNNNIGYVVMNGLIRVVASRLDETRRLLISERLWSPKMEQVGGSRQLATNPAR